MTTNSTFDATQGAAKGQNEANNKYEQAFAKYETELNDNAVSEAVKTLVEKNRDKYDTPEVLRTLLSTVELTTLKVTDSQESVLKFTENVNKFADEHPDLPLSPPSASIPTTQKS